MTDPTTQPPGSGGAASGKDLAGEFRKMPFAEKLLALAAAIVLVTWIVNEGWHFLFKNFTYGPGWFMTLSLIGSVATIGIIVTRLLGIRLMAPDVTMKVLLLCGVLPMLGFLIDQLRNFWHALMIAGAFGMVYAAAKITTREHIIKKF